MSDALTEEAADYLTRYNRPDLADHVRALAAKQNRGRTVKRDADGHTPHNVRLADLWEQIQAADDAGEDTAELMGRLESRHKLKRGILMDVWPLPVGRPEVRAILIMRGRYFAAKK